MPEQFNVTHLVGLRRPTELEHLLEVLLVGHIAAHGDAARQEPDGSFWVDVDFKIAGRPVMLGEFLVRLYREYDRLVTERADQRASQRIGAYETEMAQIMGQLRLRLGLLAGGDSDDDGLWPGDLIMRARRVVSAWRRQEPELASPELRAAMQVLGELLPGDLPEAL